ncbi:MAG: MlaE family lipid ABC transporter permease subunit [Chromatiaceae bacterium]|nr:MlaE family lipid ABC transporter permease subunit [Chromatiaceae bacterium]
MSTSREPPAIEWIPERAALRLTGAWLTPNLARVERELVAFAPAVPQVRLEADALTALDTAGAMLLQRLRSRLERQGKGVELVGLAPHQWALLDLIAARLAAGEPVAPLPAPPALEQIGRAAAAAAREGLAMMSFLGVSALALLGALRRPARLRGRAILAVLQNDGVRAMPVLGMLSFLLGVVIAYQAGIQLRLYGGNLYVVDLVSLTVLRELGPLMTAIVVAGRSGSAYTAQIGTMQVTEEIDALRSIGVSPMELLVLPKVIGLVIALPLLTVFADVVAVFGGMVMAEAMLDVRFDTFLARIPEAVYPSSFFTGVGKAPVFAAVIATVGCYQGFQVRGGADSVGRHTTTSVVQAIVLVIVADAAFSVVFSWLGI